MLLASGSLEPREGTCQQRTLPTTVLVPARTVFCSTMIGALVRLLFAKTNLSVLFSEVAKSAISLLFGRSLKVTLYVFLLSYFDSLDPVEIAALFRQPK